MTKINPRDYRPDFLKKQLENVDKHGKPRICLMCPTKLSPGLTWYCCGMCLNEAKASGVYGKESERIKN